MRLHSVSWRTVGGTVLAMPRSLWNGTISFGMIRVPVKLYTAVSSQRIGLREVHLTDGAPIQHRRICSAEEREVPYSEVVKGYEIGEDEYLALDPDDIKAAAGDRGKVIEIEHFVDEEEIDEVYYEKTQYLGSRDDEEMFEVLRQALLETGKAGIGRFTFHNREYLVAVRALGPVLALHTLRFHDELVPPERVEVPAPRRGPSKRELELAGKLIDSLYVEYEPSDYEDTWRAVLMELIERKAEGKEQAEPPKPRSEPREDLAAALEASLA